MKNETTKSADYKMVKFKDPATGKINFRKVKHDDSIIKQEEGYLGSKGEKGRDKGNAGKFDKDTAYSHAKTHNGVVHKDTSGSYLVKHGRGKNVSEEPVDEAWRKAPTPIGKGSSAKYKEAEAEYDREKSFASMRNRRKDQQKPVKKEDVKLDELSPQTKKSYLDKSSGDAERHQRIAKDYSKRSSDNVPGMDNWHKKMASAHARKSKNRAIGQSRAQESTQESVSSSDYHHTSEPSKFSGGHRPKLVHKKTGKVMYLGGHSFKKKETAKDAATAYMKGYQKGGDKSAQTHLHNFKKNNEGKTFESFRRELLDELTDKQKAEIAARKAKNLAKRGARRGPSKGTKSSEGDWTSDQQKKAKPLGFEIKKNDKHDAVHKTLAKAADASHPSLGGRKVTVKINGKSKEMEHKDLQHAVDLHKRLPLGKKAAVMNLIRDKGHDGVTAAANHFRKKYK